MSTTTTIIEVPIDGPADEEVTLNYTSEPLGAPADFGYGFPRFSIGQKLGETARYTIVRKLGWGTHGSCWMVRDEFEKRYVVVKALSGHTTMLVEAGIAQELPALLRVSNPSSPHCLSLADHFKVPGVVDVDGEHICLVTPLFGGDVATLLSTFSKEPAGVKANGTIPLQLAKRILFHTLRGLAHAHAADVTHTDLKPNNIFFTTNKDAATLEAWMARDPARSHPPEPSIECTIEPVVSQPLPAPSLEEALVADYVLSDFSTARITTEPANHLISPPGLRAPEVFLGGNWGPPADIWSFGVMIFELICHRKLFEYREHPVFGCDETTNMLLQMIAYSEETFPENVFAKWPQAAAYLSDQGGVKYFEEMQKTYGAKFRIQVAPNPLDKPIAMYMDGIMSSKDMKNMKEVMKRCLRLDPAKRVTAQDLLQDPWWNDVA